jgi:hypothetical protein
MGIFGEELQAIMVIELFEHPVAPCRRDEPEMDSIEQTEANKWPHSPRMGRAAEEGNLVVYLEVVGNAKAFPDRIDSVQNALRRS